MTTAPDQVRYTSYEDEVDNTGITDRQDITDKGLDESIEEESFTMTACYDCLVRMAVAMKSLQCQGGLQFSQ